MIIIGQAIDEKKINYKTEYLTYGQEAIKQFPLLHKILKDFPDFNKSRYDQNYFLMLASKSKYDIFRKGPNNWCHNKLQDYELLLKELNVENFKSKKRNDIFKKMNSFNRQQNHAVFKELEFLQQLKECEKIKKVIYDNFEDSNHDFRILVNGTFFNLEFASPSDSKPSKKLEKSFFRIANELIKYIPDNRYFKLDLKTDLLLNENTEMDEEYIYNLVIEKTKEIFPIIFAKEDDYCRIETRMGDPNKSFYELRDYYEHYGEWGQRLIILLQTEEGKKFLMNHSHASLGKFPISRFCYRESNDKLVEIHNESKWPSPSEKARKEAMLGQLNRLITSKIRMGQLKNQENPIIVIQFNDVIFHEYLNENDPFGPGQFEEIQEQIVNGFKETSDSEILGVIVIENYLSKSKFILNPNINIENDLLSQISLFSKIASKNLLNKNGI